MLDCRRVNALKLRFPDRQRPDVPLGPGVHAIGRDDDGRPTLVADPAMAVAQVSIDRRGAWLQVREGMRSVHVNGRPVRRMALLRMGDAIYIDGVELVLLGPDPRPLPDVEAPPAEQDTRMVLRGVGGPHHGRCLPLDQPRVVGRARACDLRIDEADLAQRHVRLEPHAQGIVLRNLGSDADSLVNGHRLRHALLVPGDQVVFESQHRFVLESPRKPAVEGADAPTVDTAAIGNDPAAAASGRAGGVGASARRIPWLLLAALLLSGALALLLLYGVR